MTKAKKKRKVRKNNNVKQKNEIDIYKKRAEQTARKKSYERAKKIAITIIKLIIIITLLVLLAIFLFTSPVFNIKEIDVVGNGKISKEEIINLSEIYIDENIYKFSKAKVKENIKKNAYIEDVQVYRMLPDKIEIEVKERKASFMLDLNGKYAYINNQGYILEITKENIYLPIITGYSNNQEIIEGNRLEEKDLKSLEKVISIMESANNNQIAELITKIDIADDTNFILTLENEQKKVYLGDASDISTRMYYLKGILQDKKGKQGEAFIDGNLNTDRVFFREKE